jgi:Dolichyl-phosphate-mannose-protein mannosyltransferase
MTLARRAAVLIPVLLGLFFLSVYLLTGSSDLLHNGDTDLRYQTTQAMVDQHRLWLVHPMWTDARLASGLGGHTTYTIYGPGQTIFMVPLYVVGKALAHHLSLPYDITTLYASRSLDLFLGAALAVLFYFMARSVGYSRGVSAVLTLIFGLATPAWPDAQSALEQTQVDLFLLLAVFSVWRFVRGELNNRRWMFLAGTALGLAVFTRYDAALYIPIVALYPAILRYRRRESHSTVGDWAWYGIGFVPWAVLVGIWNLVRFGSPFHTGVHAPTFGEPIISGLLGLSVSPGKGLLWYMPVIWLLPWAVRSLYRRHASLVVFMAAVVLISLAFYSTVLYWHGDPAWGPRYLYTSLPYLVLPLGEILSSWSRRAAPMKLAVIGLVAVSLVIQLSAVSVTQWRFWYRLQAAEEQTAHPFSWGAYYYHYYWNVQQSPILVQMDDVLQVVRLDVLGDRRYDLVNRPMVCRPHRPTPCPSSNPAELYPVNTLAFWWTDTRHPLLGARTRLALAAGLLAIAGASAGGLLLFLIRPPAGRRMPRRRLDLSAAERV